MTVTWSVETDPETRAGGARRGQSWGICMLAHAGVPKPSGLGSTKEIAGRGWGMEGVCWGCPPPNLHACPIPSLPSLAWTQSDCPFVKDPLCTKHTCITTPLSDSGGLPQETSKAVLSPAVPSGREGAKHLPPGEQTLTPGCEAQ